MLESEFTAFVYDFINKTGDPKLCTNINIRSRKTLSERSRSNY